MAPHLWRVMGSGRLLEPHRATSGSRCSAGTAGRRSATPWPPPARTTSSAWPSPRPCVTPSPPLIGSSQANDQLWHIPFNRLKNLNEHLVKGREDIYFGVKRQGLPGDVIKYYVDMLRSDPNALRGSFGRYRGFDTTIAQNQQRKNHRLTLWVPRPGPDGALLGHGARDGQVRIATLRHRLIRVPARLVRHAGTLTLRLPPGHHLLDEILARIRALPATS